MAFTIEYDHPRVVQDRRIVIVHAFLKKARTTPGHDLAIARHRTEEIQRG